MQRLHDEGLDEPSAPHKTSVLSCPACAAPCPLGFGVETACVRCRTRVALPPALLASRERQRAHDEARRAQDPIWQLALSSRPRFWQSPLFLASLSYVAPFLAAIAGYVLGYRDSHYGRAGLVWLCGIGVVHFVSSSLLRGRKPQLLRELLSAQRPESDDQPPLCRVCAAPLSVPASGRVPDDCSCDHCGADNILSETPGFAPRPDLYGSAAAYREVYGDALTQRTARLYPLTLLLGFVALGVLSYFAIHAPIRPSPWE